MDGLHLDYFLAVSVFIPLLITGKPNPPENLQVYISNNSVKFTWTIPVTEPSVLFVRLEVVDSQGTKEYIDSPRNYKDIQLPESSFEINTLTPCKEYKVQARSYNHGEYSDISEKTFWLTARNVTGDIFTDVTLNWKTNYSSFFKVMSPEKTIYNVNPGGNIIVNENMSKYLYNTSPSSVQDIGITVVKANQSDGGIYKSVSNYRGKGTIDECCLLIISGQPTRPSLLPDNINAFVGDNITFTCRSEAQRWPVGVRTSSTYKFFGSRRGEQQNDKLMIYKVSKTDKGTNISCLAIDDLGKTSNQSDIFTLDVYYGPDNVTISPFDEYVTLMEGSQFGPITCSAECNPECEILWRFNGSTSQSFEDINTNRTLIFDSVSRTKSGTYRCVARNPNDKSKFLRKNVYLNVLYPPSISYGYVTVDDEPLLKDGTTYTFTEDSKVGVILTIDSNPPVNLSLYSSTFSVQSLNFIQMDNEYNLQLPLMQCEQSGKIAISADNGIKNKTEWNTKFDIKCKPKDVQLCREKIGTQIGAEETVCLHVVSNPQPAIQWRAQGSNLAKWNIQKDQGIHKYNATSTVKIEDESNIRQYTILLKNELGWILHNVTFLPRGKPEQPSNVSFSNVTFREATLSWTAGFDGGDVQYFTINYKRTIDDTWILISVSSDKTLKGTKIYYTLRGLLPKTSYDVVLVAKNKHGSSNMSLQLTTEDEPVLVSPESSARIIPITIGVVVGFLVVLVLSIGVFFITKRNNRRREPSSTSVLYAPVDKKTKKSKGKDQGNGNVIEDTNAEYACVNKPEVSGANKKAYPQEQEFAEYAVVDKTQNHEGFDDENLYANQADDSLPIINTEFKSPGRRENNDGLTYIEVCFTNDRSGRRPIIHGDQERTNYVDIDFTRKAEPLPDDED